jgi:hypothetical protein
MQILRVILMSDFGGRADDHGQFQRIKRGPFVIHMTLGMRLGGLSKKSRQLWVLMEETSQLKLGYGSLRI